MTIVEIVTRASAAAEALANVILHARRMWASIAAWRRRRPTVAYENLLIELVLDIQDRRGMRAVLERRQRVRFLSDEAEVVRDLVWGEGEQLARYSARGAHRLLVRPEGSRRAVLLGLPRRPSKGEQVTLSSRRVIRAGFLKSSEYCETWLERPTRRVAITVIFPNGRPPREARLVTVPRQQPSRHIPVRFAADGRAYVRWSAAQPAIERTYSLRWSW